MTPRSMQMNCAENGTAPRSSKPRSFRKPSNGAGFKAFLNCAAPFLRRASRSLQVLDYKGKTELRNCAPLKGEEKAAQNGFSLPSLGGAGLGEGTTANTREDRDTPYRGVSCPSARVVSAMSARCPLFVRSVSA